MVPRAFALPILVPGVQDLSWTEVASLRQHPSIRQLRDVLQEIEGLALERIDQGVPADEAVRCVYDERLRKLAEDVQIVRPLAKSAAVGLVAGTGLGYATMGLALFGPIIGAAAGTAIGTAVEAKKLLSARSERGWVGAMSTIQSCASHGTPSS